MPVAATITETWTQGLRHVLRGEGVFVLIASIIQRVVFVICAKTTSIVKQGRTLRPLMFVLHVTVLVLGCRITLQTVQR